MPLAWKPRRTAVLTIGWWSLRHLARELDDDGLDCEHLAVPERLLRVGLRVAADISKVLGGHAFIQNLRRGHYELEVEARPPIDQRNSARRPGDQALIHTGRVMRSECARP